MHFVVSMLALLASLEGLTALDVPGYQPSWIKNIGDVIFKCLMFPAIELKMLFDSSGLYINDFFEWVLVIANSIAYAFCLDYIISKFFRRAI
jgi:hypothetical protein